MGESDHDPANLVTADPDGDAGGPNFGDYFTEIDYARIPRWRPAERCADLHGQRRLGPCCQPAAQQLLRTPLSRRQGEPPPVAAGRVGEFLRYRYENGQLIGAKRKNGRKVNVDAFGIPT